ncbi:MAG: M48 family metalloprotease [Thermodesulfobacteriota bacterium]
MTKAILIILIFIPCVITGCAGFDVGSVARVAEQTFQAARPLSDEEEYYVGRSVAANILSTYPVLQDRSLTEYVNLVGQTVAIHSDDPITYGGYHFAILDTDEINAYACPGGIILITRGMINQTQNEDELAAVIAHEVSHINHRDGVSAIQKARLTGVATLIATEAAATYSPAEISQLVSLFEGSVDDVFKTLVVNGYGKSQEYSADESAVIYLSRAGYDPQALEIILERLMQQGQGSSGGIMKTHPGSEDRIARVAEEMPATKIDPSLVQLRMERFEKAVR